MKKQILFFLITCCLVPFYSVAQQSSPRIINVINFIRELEPRNFGISSQDLYEATYQESQQMKAYGIKGTWLIQYDALIDTKYQQLLKSEIARGSEVGGWWEITQPHVEAAGLEWRGRYPWDWHANVGFSVGYTPAERETLVDIYMERFKEIFGCYPKSVGSWIIDAHSLNYMYEKYGIIASCICRDQVGTDGYTLFGGYWNGAYYPSKVNAYMPAQTVESQIPVPIFRMLGSDPIYQYDASITGNGQSVFTLETICYGCGDDEKWVKSFFKSVFEDPCLGFSYTQSGQENSFSWSRIEKGFKVQMQQIENYRKKGMIRIETLAESAEWYKSRYKVTPATSLTTLEDTFDKNHQSIWFNCRNYRANLMADGQRVFFRDIHLFDERVPSDYLSSPTSSNEFNYRTFPIMDGCNWTKANRQAGILFMARGKNGEFKELNINSFHKVDTQDNQVRVMVNSNIGKFLIILDEQQINVSTDTNTEWRLLLTAPGLEQLPVSVNDDALIGTLKGYKAELKIVQGNLLEEANDIWFVPFGNKISLSADRIQNYANEGTNF